MNVEKKFRKQEYFAAGTYTFTVPEGVTRIDYLAVGGGGAGGLASGANGNSGGHTTIDGKVVGIGGAGGYGSTVSSPRQTHRNGSTTNEDVYYGGKGRTAGPSAAEPGQDSSNYSGGTGQVDDPATYANGGGGGASEFGNGGNGGTFGSQNGKTPSAGSWGAGGGGDNGSPTGGGGGAGSKTKYGFISVTSRQTLTIVVGAGGAASGNNGSGINGICILTWYE